MHTMKALVKREPGRGLWLEEVPRPEVGNNDVLIKVTKVAICGTDLHIYKWDDWAARTIKPPMTIGHEFVGTIVAFGEDVRGYQVGDRVSGEGHIVCNVCRSCRAGKRHLCRNTIGLGVNRNGAFAEYLSLPASNVWKVDPRIDDRSAAVFDPFGNAIHTTLSFDLVGEDVLITGAGPIGLMAVTIAKRVGARYVFITDVNDYRLALARRLGATRAINVSRESVEEHIADIGMIGFDIGLEMSGSPAAFRTMLSCMYHGGRIALLGLFPEQAAINWDQVIFKGLFIKGIYGREMWETWYKGENMLRSGLDIPPVITHTFPFENFQQGFDTMLEGNCAKVILDLP